MAAVIRRTVAACSVLFVALAYAQNHALTGQVSSVEKV
jgi:hypothetical protein